MFAFRHAASNCAALHRALRHMPTTADIAIQMYIQDHRCVFADQCLSFADWLEPDEDYVQAFVVGWHDDCAIAVGNEWLGAGECEIEAACPWYAITSSTSGIDCKSLKLRQPVLCTVPRSWGAVDREWKYVKSCDAPHEVPLP